MGSFYQPSSYLKGGRTKKQRKTNGGFSPSIMGGVIQSGRILLPLAFKHATALLSNHKTRRGKKGKKRSMRKKRN